MNPGTSGLITFLYYEDLVGGTLQEVTAPFDGVVSFLRTHYSVNAGDTLLWVAEI